MSTKYRTQATNVLHVANRIWPGSIAERIIKILYSGQRSRQDLLEAVGCSNGTFRQTISFLISRKFLSVHEHNAGKYYSLSELGNYLHLCAQLEISFMMAKILALAYYNFDVSAKKNLPIDFPVTKAEVNAKVSVYGYLCSEEAAWVRARELACREFGYLRNGCFILYPHAYRELKQYDSILRSLYSYLSEVPSRAALLMLKDPVLREKAERFAAVCT